MGEESVSIESDPSLYHERMSVASSSRDRIGELGRVLESPQSKVIEGEMSRRLHSDLKW
jgi:hypothetical protein